MPALRGTRKVVLICDPRERYLRIACRAGGSSKAAQAPPSLGAHRQLRAKRADPAPQPPDSDAQVVQPFRVAGGEPLVRLLDRLESSARDQSDDARGGAA